MGNYRRKRSFVWPDLSDQFLLSLNHIISSFLNQVNARMTSEISVEYMDSESYPEFSYWTAWLESLFDTYGDPPELVVLIGGEVWSAYREYCPEPWKDIAVVLGGVKGGFIDYKNWSVRQVLVVDSLPRFHTSFDDFKVTGYYIQDYLVENIQLVYQLQPEVTDIAFYYDDRYDHHFLKSYLQVVAGQFDHLRVHYWMGSSLSTSDLVDSITSYKGNIALIYVNIQTADGQVKSEKIANYYRLRTATPEQRQNFEYGYSLVRTGRRFKL